MPSAPGGVAAASHIERVRASPAPVRAEPAHAQAAARLSRWAARAGGRVGVEVEAGVQERRSLQARTSTDPPSLTSRSPWRARPAPKAEET